MLQALSDHKNTSTVQIQHDWKGDFRGALDTDMVTSKIYATIPNNMTQNQKVWKSVLNVTFRRKLRNTIALCGIIPFGWQCEGHCDRKLYSTVLDT